MPVALDFTGKSILPLVAATSCGMSGTDVNANLIAAADPGFLFAKLAVATIFFDGIGATSCWYIFELMNVLFWI